MDLKLSADFKKLSKGLNSMQRTQLPFVISKTINEVAFASIDKNNPEGLKQKAKDTFEGGATNFTVGGFRFRKSTKKNLTAYVFVESAREKYMKFQIKGGTRQPHNKTILVPTKNIKLNKFGNLTRATRNKLFDDKKKFFEGIPKGLTGDNNRGIWERYGRNKANPSGQRIRMVANYVGQAQYRPKFPFKKTVEGVVFGQKRGIGRTFEKNLKLALKTMRRR
jgi:hypothetical protein|tara:strand:+ start:53 stop:718 length:666 start_codon:yes stop_codon:yes gene_type:complete